MFKPKEPFSTSVELFNPTTTTVMGVTRKTWISAGRINCSFKTYGGTESISNDVLTVIDTAKVTTWYRADITSASQIRLGAKSYEVIGEPEDIDLRHQYLQFKVRAVKGGA